MKQKHFMDIENLREEDTELRFGNGHGFEIGDIVSVTTKIDGSNAAITYDQETDQLVAFSRKHELNCTNTLNGFWNFAQSLDKTIFSNIPGCFVYGEWMVSHKVKYQQDFYKKWYVYDVYDTVNQKWWNQKLVKGLCETSSLNYINEVYYGPFQGWDRIRSFLDHHWMGLEYEEGVVVKNMTKLNSLDPHLPFYLKVVNDGFKESMKTREKVVDSETEAARSEAQNIVESIVTRNRVEKELYKMRDEGIIPEKIRPQEMKLVAQNLPKRIYDDCVKEEKELVDAAGEYFGKMCSTTAMKLAREIILS